VRRGFLHVAQWHPRFQRHGDEGVPEGVRPDFPGDPGLAGDPADDPPGAVAVQPPQEKWLINHVAKAGRGRTPTCFSGGASHVLAAPDVYLL
jgi:hypothetical protein